MKKCLFKYQIIVLLICSTSLIHAQNEEFKYFNINKYKNGEINAEFIERFKKDEDKENFKRLREFLVEKESLFDALQMQLGECSDRTKDMEIYRSKISGLKDCVEGKKNEDTVRVKRSLFTFYIYNDSYRLYSYDEYEGEGSSVYSSRLFTVEEVKNRIVELEDMVKDMEDETVLHKNLDANIRNVKQDIDDCRNQIDSALAPEYKQQEFRTTISIYFTGLIALLLMIFFFILYKKSDNNLSKELLSGNGLQFITLFVLIIAVILFGILGILRGSELAAILSGISGYILGKGVNVGKKNISAAANSLDINSTGTGVI